MLCGQRKSRRTWTKQWNPSVIFHQSLTIVYRQSIAHNTHGLLAVIVCVVISLRTRLWLQTRLPHITHILLSEPFLFSCLNANSSSEWTACHISHTPLIWLTVSIVLPNHTQFILVNRLLCIAHAFIWLPVSFVTPHRKQLIELNHMPFIAHAIKTWTVFDASVIANVLYVFDGFHTTPFAIMASHIVSRRVSDRSVALAASCSSAPSY